MSQQILEPEETKNRRIAAHANVAQIEYRIFDGPLQRLAASTKVIRINARCRSANIAGFMFIRGRKRGYLGTHWPIGD